MPEKVELSVIWIHFEAAKLQVATCPSFGPYTTIAFGSSQ